MMKVVLSWLREFAPHRAVSRRDRRPAQRLGLEVRGAHRVGGGLDGIVVGQACSRSASTPTPTRSVWSTSIRVTARRSRSRAAHPTWRRRPGRPRDGRTVMPDGMEIAAARCGASGQRNALLVTRARAAATTTAASSILPADLPVGGDPSRGTGDRADGVFDLDVNPNRPDALSVLGVARDMAARSGCRSRCPTPGADESGAGAGPRRGSRSKTRRCAAASSPGSSRACPRRPVAAWLAERLHAAGMRPDQQRGRRLELRDARVGQPKHAYDLASRQAAPAGPHGPRRRAAGDARRRRARSADDGVIVDGDDRRRHRRRSWAAPHGDLRLHHRRPPRGGLVEPDVDRGRVDPLNLRSEASRRFSGGNSPTPPAFVARRFAEPP